MDTQSDTHGILVVDKPQGPTSHDIVAGTRRHFGTRRVGHTGTLDPMATGVLVLLMGEGTKLSRVLGTDDKVYRARVKFGFATNTDDALGTPTLFGSLNSQTLSSSRLESALDVERARVVQAPPAFSAIKKDGQPIYRQARLGISVHVEPRPVTVRSLQVVEMGDDFVDLVVHSSKGYYVRALARDLGTSLDCPAHLSELRRLKAGQFELDSATTWPLPSKPKLMSVTDAARAILPSFELTEAGERRARLGQTLTAADFRQNVTESAADTDMAWLYEGQLVAIGRWKEPGTLRVERGFNLGVFEQQPLCASEASHEVTESET